MRNKFPQKSRLTTATQFKQVFSRTKKKIFAETFTIYFCCNNLSYPRLGVIVPKKNINKAHERNFFKRVVREGFRLNQHRLKKIDLVVFVNGDIKKASQKAPRQILKEQLDKLIV